MRAIMSIHGPVNPSSDDDTWGGCSDFSDSSDSSTDCEMPSGPGALAEFNDDTSYPTVEALQDAVNAFAKNVGYAVGR